MDLLFLRRLVKKAYTYMLRTLLPNQLNAQTLMEITEMPDFTINLLTALLNERKSELALQAQEAAATLAFAPQHTVEMLENRAAVRLQQAGGILAAPFNEALFANDLNALRGVDAGPVANSFARMTTFPLIEKAPPPDLALQLHNLFPNILPANQVAGALAYQHNEKWTPHQHRLFIRAIQAFGTNFDAIAQQIPGKTRGEVRAYFIHIGARPRLDYLVGHVPRIDADEPYFL